MSNELIINASLPETRIALMEDGEIQELLIERASGKGIVGNIYKGRVTRVLPGMQAAFVDIGLEKAAFLYVDDVYVHSELWEDEEGESKSSLQVFDEVQAQEVELQGESQGEVGNSPRVESPIRPRVKPRVDVEVTSAAQAVGAEELTSQEPTTPEVTEGEVFSEEGQEDGHQENEGENSQEDADLDEDEEDSETPVKMDTDPNDSSEGSDGNDAPQGTITPDASAASGDAEGDATGPKKRHRRGRRGGRFRRKGAAADPAAVVAPQEAYPENYHEQLADPGNGPSDRSGLEEQSVLAASAENPVEAGRPEIIQQGQPSERRVVTPVADRAEFKAPRSRDRRIWQKTASRPVRAQVNIQDLLKEGQEVLVQVAKDPIATKGARLTCHISLPGRHLVCMPTIDHVGVSRRIEREDERRRLREFVEKNRPRNLGFIVRTASGKQQSEKRIKQDIDYLTHLWNEIREKSATLTAPALVYEDLNSVLRAIRDWVTEDIDKVIVDSRYHYNDILRFVSHFMPSLKQKVELYHGDIPIFDAYGISTELSRSLERKVWLKSGGYIVIDQAEALVAIDVNTGRYVGKKNLEDTILKTNLEAVQEIAYQLRLRNCGGIIILDLIDMEKDENKQRVYRALEDALQRDRARPSILKISELGLIEMTRKRTRDTIIRTLCESCTHCEGKGFIKSKFTVAYEVMREVEREGIERDVSKILVQAHPDVIDILAIDERESLDQLERRYRKSIYLQAVTDFHPEQFEVSADKKVRSERGRDHAEGTHSREQSGERHRSRGSERNRNRNEAPAPMIAPTGEPVAVIRPLPTPLPVPLAESGGPVAIGRVSSKVSRGDEVADPGNVESVGPTALRGAEKHPDESMDEEDRLAFLRAQAAQDAALARLGNGNGNAHSSRPAGGGDHQNRNARTAPGRRWARGRRGGKFKRGTDKGRERGPQKSFSQGSGPKWNDGPKESGGLPVGVEVAHSSNSSGNDSGNGGSSDG